MLVANLVDRPAALGIILDCGDEPTRLLTDHIDFVHHRLLPLHIRTVIPIVACACRLEYS